MTKPAECERLERAAVFVDGSNFYNACVNQPRRDAGLLSPADYYDLDFMALARKLAGGRTQSGQRALLCRAAKAGKRAVPPRPATAAD